MTLSNTTSHYGSVTRSFHWLIALLVLTLIPVAMIAQELPYETAEQLTRKALLFSLHKTLGVSVFLIALLRILWAVTQTKPASLHPKRKVETLLAETAHWLLYGSLVLAPLSGWIHHAATSGFAPIWWPLGQSLPMVPKSEYVAAVAGGFHWVFGKVMVVTLIAHLAGALKHHFIDQDATLRRMLGRAPDLPALAPTQHRIAPLLGAAIVWAGALALGSVLGVYSEKGAGVTAATLQDVTSGWTVQDGQITLNVTQFGSEVQGSFADWTASITYDDDVMSGPAGAVDAVISIGSLTLGSVTDQAMGPDFFDATTFETATYTADLIKGIDGFMAEGTLTIKDRTVPVTMPFSLLIDGDTAQMHASLTLDRRSYGIGDNMNDESALAFDVGVNIDLVATRASDAQ